MLRHFREAMKLIKLRPSHKAIIPSIGAYNFVQICSFVEQVIGQLGEVNSNKLKKLERKDRVIEQDNTY